MDLSARQAESRVVASNCLGVGRFSEAIHFAVGVVEKLDLANPKFIRLAVFRLLRYLENGFIGQFQIVVKIHELWH